MAAAFEVNGAATVTFGGSLLGLTIDGAEYTITPYFEDCIVDSFGSRVPGDEQCMLATARVDVEIVYFDPSVLQTCLKIGGAAYGTMPAAGTLMGAGSFYKPIVIGGSNGATFNSCRLMAGGPIKKGTRRTTNRLSFLAVPYDGSKIGSSSAGAVLFS